MQIDNKDEDREHVVFLFQGMLEVVTRDMMEEQLSRYFSLNYYNCNETYRVILPILSWPP